MEVEPGLKRTFTLWGGRGGSFEPPEPSPGYGHVPSALHIIGATLPSHWCQHLFARHVNTQHRLMHFLSHPILPTDLIMVTRAILFQDGYRFTYILY